MRGGPRVSGSFFGFGPWVAVPARAGGWDLHIIIPYFPCASCLSLPCLAGGLAGAGDGGEVPSLASIL